MEILTDMTIERIINVLYASLNHNMAEMTIERRNAIQDAIDIVVNGMSYAQFEAWQGNL